MTADFDIDRLRVRAATPARRALPQRHLRSQDRFVKGPIPLTWLAMAAGLPGHCLHVGLAVWYLVGLQRNEVVELRPMVLRTFDVSRYAGYRALMLLEQAGLIRVQRNRGRSAIVTIESRPSGSANPP